MRSVLFYRSPFPFPVQSSNFLDAATLLVIRGLAVKTLHKNNIKEFLLHELQMATCITLILSFTGFVRAVVFRISPMEILAITCSLAMIVFSSICLGAILPLLLRRLGVDPAHSSTTIQVIMDILGVVFTCTVSSAVLRG